MILMGSADEKIGYEPGRLRRAALRPCVRLGPMEFMVAGKSKPVHYVDLRQDPACECADIENRGGMLKGRCLHVLCAELHNGDEALLTAYGEMLMRAGVE